MTDDLDGTVYEGQRCRAVCGGVWEGPMFCGNKAKVLGPDGRPLCGVHKNKHQPRWIGAAPYPEGTFGKWEWSRGPKRKKPKLWITRSAGQ